MSLHKTVLLVFLALLAQGVFAQAIFSTALLEFHNKPESLSFVVKNDSNFEQPLNIEFFGPSGLEYEFIGAVPVSIPAQSELEIEMRFFPSAQLVGTEYKNQVLVTVGETKTSKTISMAFLKEVIEAGEEKEEENTKAGENNGEENSSVATIGFALLGFLSPQILIDIFLAFIAAILLIAFIARLVKRIEVAK